jgi:hypothetical protein
MVVDPIPGGFLRLSGVRTAVVRQLNCAVLPASSTSTLQVLPERIRGSSKAGDPSTPFSQVTFSNPA